MTLLRVKVMTEPSISVWAWVMLIFGWSREANLKALIGVSLKIPAGRALPVPVTADIVVPSAVADSLLWSV